MRSDTILKRLPLHRFIFYILLAVAPVQLGYHFWPDWSYVLGRRIDYLSPTLYFTDILILGCVTSWAVFRLRQPHSSGLSRRKQHLFVLGAIGILTFVTINIVMATIPVLALYRWMKLAEFFLLGLYIVVTKPSRSVVVLLLTVAAVWSAGLAILQLVLQHTVGGWWWWLGERTFSIDTPGIARSVICLPGKFGCTLLMRPYATFPHPNVLAGFLVPVIAAYVATKKQISLRYASLGFTGNSLKILVHAVPVLLGLALFLTLSRSAFLSLGISGLLYAVWSVRNMYRSNHRNHPKVFPPPYLLISLTALFMVTIAVLMMLPDISSSGDSLRLREALVGPAVDAFQASPVFGVGLGNFIPSRASMLPRTVIQVLQPVHSIYLLLLSETGSIGIVLYTLLVLSAFRRGIRHTSPFIWSLIPMLLIGTVDHYYLTLQQGQLIQTLILSVLYI